jgi:3',5'-cyclic AMP phosphodiesterase CpdA
MIELVHVSDLHFGTEDPAVAEGLLKALAERTPDLLVVSGDLTQRALPAQFAAARRWLDYLAIPRLVIPGNHDQPLWNIWRRLVAPLAGFRQFVTPDLEPTARVGDALVLGLDTTWRWVWKRGCIRQRHLESIRACLGAPDDPRVRIIVTHHPFLPAPGAPCFAPMYGRTDEALALLRRCGPAVLLAGHLHLGDTGGIHATESGSLLAIQAGTAISKRIREQVNTFNRLQIQDQEISVTVCQWNGERFEDGECQRYVRERRVWVRVE